MNEINEYRKRPVVITAYQTTEEKTIETLEGTMKASKGDFIITEVNGEQYPCKPDIFYETYVLNDESIDDRIEDNLYEWSSLITELSEKEIQFHDLKEAIFKKEQEIINTFNFEEVYGKNNKDVRKSHLDKVMGEEYKVKQELEFSIDFLKRRIPFLKQLIYTKTVMMELRK